MCPYEYQSRDEERAQTQLVCEENVGIYTKIDIVFNVRGRPIVWKRVREREYT